MTGSTAEPTTGTRPRPVLRRLVDVLPPPGAPPLPLSPLPLSPPRATLHAVDPQATALARRVLAATVEVIAGHRPLPQLARVLPDSTLGHVAELCQIVGPLRPALQHAVHTQQPAPGALEAWATVTLRELDVVRALAARFEVHIGGNGARWLCVSLGIRLTGNEARLPRRRRR